MNNEYKWISNEFEISLSYINKISFFMIPNRRKKKWGSRVNLNKSSLTINTFTNQTIEHKIRFKRGKDSKSKSKRRRMM